MDVKTPDIAGSQVHAFASTVASQEPTVTHVREHIVIEVVWGYTDLFDYLPVAVCSNCASPRVCTAPETCQCHAGLTGENCEDGETDCAAAWEGVGLNCQDTI